MIEGYIKTMIPCSSKTIDVGTVGAHHCGIVGMCMGLCGYGSIV